METTLNGHFWYRKSTEEWIFEVSFNIPDVIFSVQRYPGKTKRDALVCFSELIEETMKDDLNLITQHWITSRRPKVKTFLLAAANFFLAALLLAYGSSTLNTYITLSSVVPLAICFVFGRRYFQFK